MGQLKHCCYFRKKVERGQGNISEIKMQTHRFKHYYRQVLIAALIVLMVFFSMPSWSLSSRATAYSSIKDGIVHVGRAEVINGEAIMRVVQRPVAGAPIQLVASL